MQEERIFWIAWSLVPGIGSVILNRLKQHFGHLQLAWYAPASALLEVDGIGPQVLATIECTRPTIEPRALPQDPCWIPTDPDYPGLLLEIPSYPAVLYHRGQGCFPTQGLPNVAIVGTRNPSEYGKRWTRKLTALLVRHHYTIVSGLADGIDTEAHRTCLEFGGRTIAVLGSGVDVVYPSRNRELYHQLLKQGLALSEYPAGTKPDRMHFPQRNRIVAGLCRAVIVIEAPARSGALITAHLANDYGRDVYVLPGSLDQPNAIGCLGLISKGAQVILGEDHLLELLGTLPIFEPVQSAQPVHQLTLPRQDLPPELQQILQTIPHEPISFELIVQQLNRSTSEVSSSLLQLELEGLITQLPGMRYQRLYSH